MTPAPRGPQALGGPGGLCPAAAGGWGPRQGPRIGVGAFALRLQSASRAPSLFLIRLEERILIDGQELLSLLRAYLMPAADDQDREEVEE